MALFETYHGHDWCHICGERKQFLTGIRYPKNAEHDKELTKYIRICSDCSQHASKVASKTKPRDQKVLAHDPDRPHEWAESTRIGNGGCYCSFCQEIQDGAWLANHANINDPDQSDVAICRDCVRLALWRMAEIPEAQS